MRSGCATWLKGKTPAARGPFRLPAGVSRGPQTVWRESRRPIRQAGLGLVGAATPVGGRYPGVPICNGRTFSPAPRSELLPGRGQLLKLGVGDVIDDGQPFAMARVAEHGALRLSGQPVLRWHRCPLIPARPCTVQECPKKESD